MNDKLLIVGGYGKVGRIISTMLGEKFPGRVVVAGRNYHEAKAFSAAAGGKVFPMALDIHGSDNVELLQGVKIVVMCVERPDVKFVENCLRWGVHYVDISASYEWLSQIESMQDGAKEGGATAVLSVGLAPGLTNLLAADNKILLDEIRCLDIFVMLGLGEVHGEAAVRWTVENAIARFISLMVERSNRFDLLKTAKKQSFWRKLAAGGVPVQFFRSTGGRENA